VSTSTFTINPNLLQADNTSAAVLTFMARDIYGNIASGAGVTFISTGSNNHYQSVHGNDERLGCIHCDDGCRVTPKSKRSRATSGNASIPQTVIFLAGPATSGTSNPVGVTFDRYCRRREHIDPDRHFERCARQPRSECCGHLVVNPVQTTPSDKLPETTDASGVFSTTLASTTAETKEPSRLRFAGGGATTSLTFVAGTPSSTNHQRVRLSPNSNRRRHQHHNTDVRREGCVREPRLFAACEFVGEWYEQHFHASLGNYEQRGGGV